MAEQARHCCSCDPHGCETSLEDAFDCASCVEERELDWARAYEAALQQYLLEVE